MSARVLRFTEEQWRDQCAKRHGWTTHFAPPVETAAADGPKRKPGKVNPPPHLEASAAVVSDAYQLVNLCKADGLPPPIPEYAFAAPARKWRADYCWPVRKVIVEIDGGLFVNGRHSRGAGMLKDFEKLNAATLLGFRVLRYGPQQLAECLRDLRILFAE
jgi:hypothetical protein